MLVAKNNATHTVVKSGEPSDAGPAYGAYAFFFSDANVVDGLGCYRLEAQFFVDPAWPPPTKEL